MKKLLVITLMATTLTACSNDTNEENTANGMEVFTSMSVTDEDGNEVILSETEQSSEYIVAKTFYIQNLLYELELDTVTLGLTENDDGSVYFQATCIGDDTKSKVDKMLEIISDNLDNVDFDNSIIIDYGLMETDPDNAVLYSGTNIEIIAYEDISANNDTHNEKLINTITSFDDIKTATIDISNSKCSIEVTLQDTVNELSDELKQAIINTVTNVYADVDENNINITIK